jgi:long-chain acyl-CoA synthetase
MNLPSDKLTPLDLVEQSEVRAPSNPAIITTQKTISYRELLAQSRNAAHGILKQTAGQEVVALFFTMSAEFVAAYLATLFAGKRALPLNLLLPPEELLYILKDSGAGSIIAPPELAPKIAPLGAKVFNWAEICQPQADGALPRPQPEDLCTLLYTSGTTGRPKGVCLTQWNLASNAKASVEMMHIAPDYRFLACLPTFHTFAITATILAPLAAGASLVPLPRFDPEGVLSATANLQCNMLLMVPSMYRLMVRMQERKHFAITLKLAISGGEPLPVEVRESFAKVFGVPLLEGYGQTEASPIISFNMPWDSQPGTVGKPLPNVRIQIADPNTGTVLPPGNNGEIWVQGPNIMRGYHNRPEETAQALAPGGWLRTGDMGTLTPEGFLKITGRLREMIKVGGEMVFPAEVENALLLHPAVAEAGVAGAKDERKGEMVKAYVVLKTGQQATVDELLTHCRNNLAAYKVPRVIEFRVELPKSPTGKVLRRLLK